MSFQKAIFQSENLQTTNCEGNRNQKGSIRRQFDGPTCIVSVFDY